MAIGAQLYLPIRNRSAEQRLGRVPFRPRCEEGCGVGYELTSQIEKAEDAKLADRAANDCVGVPRRGRAATRRTTRTSKGQLALSPLPLSPCTCQVLHRPQQHRLRT